MYPLIETIACVNGQLLHLEYHQRRLQKTILKYTDVNTIDLRDLRMPYGLTGRVKCRILYDIKGIRKIEFSTYTPRPVDALRLVYNDHIVYAEKSSDREHLDTLANQLNGNEDMIIIKSGLVTDSWYANLAFYDGTKWYTPNSPLLKGIKRQYLLDRGMLAERVIRAKDIFKYKEISLINAMLDLGEISISVDNIKS